MAASRPVDLRRSWLFVPGGDAAALRAAPNSGADVLIQELEDFVPPQHKRQARALLAPTMAAWTAAGAVAAVRINPLFGPDGAADLEAAMRAGAQTVLLPKTRHAEDIVALDRAVARWERELGRLEGGVELVPNVESARALLNTLAIATATPRVVACLVASEDMAADLGAERMPGGPELDYVRQRFLVECTAAGVLAIDCPYTWSDLDGALREGNWARRLGYRAKSLVAPAQARALNLLFTPQADAVAEARRIVEAFEAAQARGDGGVELDGNLVELPTYANARRLLARAAAFDALARGR
ncbi:MAG: CoA ester lyase [Reyranellaceae bacterium]